MHTDHLTLALPDEAATLALGASLGASLGAALGAALAATLTSRSRPGLSIWLEGDLGAGKTTLVRGLLRAAGETGPVKSPSYAIVEVHPISGLHFYHFDFYRFNHPDEYLDAGLEEYFSENSICLVEWPNNARPYLPDADLRIVLTVEGVGREAQLVAHSAKGQACLAAVTR